MKNVTLFGDTKSDMSKNDTFDTVWEIRESQVKESKG
jgi:hypothetical protein